MSKMVKTVMGLDRLLIDDPETGLFRVHRSAMTSEEVLALERERIFDRCWLYLGHASEVESPGDFVRRHVAGRPLFFVRGEDGQIRVFYNTCPHRGALVCRRDRGQAKVFQCFYHAWTFNTRGELVGIPDEEGYPCGFDRRERSLQGPPRVESYRGFIFVSFNPEVESLESYLAGAKEYLDLVADQAEEGMRVLPGSNRYHIRANWKLLVENSIDGYHYVPTHETYIEFITTAFGKARPSELPGFVRSLGNGHVVLASQPGYGRPIAVWHPMFGEEVKMEIEDIRKRMALKYGEERARLMCDYARNLLIYPNLIINDIVGITIRVFWPIRPDYMEVLAWELAPKEETGQRLQRRLDNFLTFVGPGGLATPDDVEALESCQAGYTAGAVEWSDLSRGTQREPKASDELQMRVFWRQWHANIMGKDKAERWEDLPVRGRVEL
jgi:p-cumate 2,3-dioxygenase alpha subunit